MERLKQNENQIDDYFQIADCTFELQQTISIGMKFASVRIYTRLNDEIAIAERYIEANRNARNYFRMMSP